MDNNFDLACSSIGRNHQEAGTVLQDASLFCNEEMYDLIVVADGHGSENHPRSDRGSRMACAAAEEAIREFASEADPEEFNRSPKREKMMVEQLCKNILARWNALVEQDVKDDPFTEDEVAEVAEKYRSLYLSGQDAVRAYGTTLLFALVTKSYFLAVRNGDGECVIVDRNGGFIAPVPGNENNEASFVTSMCDEDAIENFRYHYSETIPAAVFIGTDGIENSYATREALFSLYRNICLSAIRNGEEHTRQEIETTLPRLTSLGSGDDVSIAAIMDVSALKAFETELRKKAETDRKMAELEQTERDGRSIRGEILRIRKKMEELDALREKIGELEMELAEKEQAAEELRREIGKMQEEGDRPANQYEKQEKPVPEAEGDDTEQTEAGD